MDLWAWVRELIDELHESDEVELAELINGFPSMALSGQPEAVAAAVPQLLAAAKALRRPWLEVYTRHWQLQSRGSKQGEGMAVLMTAIEALDRAHTEEAEGCPQAVCIVQDLCVAYSNFDDVGYARERLDVTSEALGRIDRTWECFRCLSVEHAAALVDSGRPQEALDFLARQQQLSKREHYVEDRFSGERVRAALALERPDEALRAVEAAERRPCSELGETREVERRLERAQALAALGRMQEAESVLPGAADVEPCSRADWVRVAEALVAAERLANDADLGRLLREWMHECLAAGAFSGALSISAAAVRLAALRGSRWSAGQALAQARAAAGGLRDPSRADDLLDELSRAAVAVAAPPPTPDATDALHSDDLHEAQVDVWLAAAADRPDDEEALVGAAARLAQLGELRAARTMVSDFVSAHRNADEALLLLVEIAVGEGPEACADVARDLDAHAPEAASWLRARWAYSEERYDDCAAMCATLVESRPDAPQARRLWARAAAAAGDYEQVLELLEQLLDLAGADTDEAVGDHWWRMVAGTVVGRWDAVRDSARHLQLELESEAGAIDETWHTVIVCYDDGTDELALRTGPVSARVLSVAPPGQLQRADDLLVFNPVFETPAPEEEDKNWIPVHRHLVTLEKGNRTAYVVVGLEVGDEVLQRAVDAVRDAGARLWVESSSVSWWHPDDGEAAGFSARVAVPPDGDAAAVQEALAGVFGSIPDPQKPVLWPHLAAAGSDVEAAAAHREEWERWGFF